MRARLAWFGLALAFAPLPAVVRAGDGAPPDASIPAADSAPTPSQVKTTYEFDADTAYVGNARSNFGFGNKGDISEESTGGRLVVAPQVDDGPIYRFGLAFQRYSFGLSKAAPLPDILQSENLVVGMDFQLFNSWLVRAEADPGFYNDGRATGFRDFNVPFSIGGSYIAGDALQWVIGLEVDVNRQIPVIPAVGVRWSINDAWVLDLILPTPRLEYQWSKNLTLYIGAGVDDGTYRMDRGFAAGMGSTKPTTVAEAGPLRERVVGYREAVPQPPVPILQAYREKVYTTSPGTSGPNLGGAVVEYDEVRIGAGLSWKASKVLTFEIEGGYLPYREFDFHRADFHLSNDGGAPYGRASLNAQF